MGLWRTHEIGVCDHCGERWGTASKGIVTPCPSCGADHSGLFGYGVQRNCWECGTVWESPPPPKPVTRMSRLGDAMTMTGIIGMFVVIGFFALCGLAFVAAVLYVAPILLVPVGLIALVVAFFYFTFRPKVRRTDGQAPDADSHPSG
jgi:hypothetical protein